MLTQNTLPIACLQHSPRVHLTAKSHDISALSLRIGTDQPRFGEYIESSASLVFRLLLSNQYKITIMPVLKSNLLEAFVAQHKKEYALQKYLPVVKAAMPNKQ